MEFLLPKEQLKGLSPEDQKAVKDEAFNQFLLGSIFGGGGISTGYQAVQNIIPNLQKTRQQQGLLQELQGIQQDFFPTAAQAGQRALGAEGRGPTLTAAQNQQSILSQPVDYGAAMTRLGRLSTNPNASQVIPSLTNVIKEFKPEVINGVVTDINRRPTGVVPSADLKSGLTLGGTVQGGKVNFETAPLTGFRSATALNTLPELAKGEEYLFDATGQPAGIRNAAGALNALAQRTAVERGVTEANIPRPSVTDTGAPTFAYANPPGLAGLTGQQAGTNQPTGTAQPTVAQPITGPSTAQTTLNAAFKPILDDAYKGFQTAKKTAPVIDQLQNAYNQPGFDTGSFTNFRTQLGNVFNSLGVSGERNKQFLTNAISARQGINALTGESLSEAVGAISNFEIGYYGQRNAQITDPKESTNFNLAVLREANKRKQDFQPAVRPAQ